MAQLTQLHPVLQTAHQCNQLTPQQAWELDRALSLGLPLTKYGQILLTWVRLVDCPVDLLTEQ
jgi:hypothetical protein